MKPTIVIVGRPNVGKSTLFNRLTRSRDALVADFPGLTRDRHYGVGRIGNRPYLVVDTGGFEPLKPEGVMAEMARQAESAIAEGDAILFMVDARDGVKPQDANIAEKLRREGRRVWLVANKAEGMDGAVAGAEFHELGLGTPTCVSASHGDGVRALMDLVLEDFPPEPEDDGTEGSRAPKVAIVGRPNVGKSTLVNALVGEERVIAFDQPGTTRDSIFVEFTWKGRPYTLIDTAGLRRKGKVFETIEKFSVIKTLQAIDDANVVVLVLDASADIAEQDAHIAGFIVERGRALVVAINKWDGLSEQAREEAKRSLVRKLKFLAFASIHFISAKERTGIAPMMEAVDRAYASAMTKLSTPRLSRILAEAVERQSPPKRGRFRPKLRYAHQGGMNPPVIVVHGNATDSVTEAYRRYLEGTFRKAFDLEGTPLRIEFKSGRNPYVKE